MNPMKLCQEMPVFDDIAFAQARSYARLVDEGEYILEDTDGPRIAAFRQYLPAAFAERHLCLEQVAGGWRVERVAVDA